VKVIQWLTLGLLSWPIVVAAQFCALETMELAEEQQDQLFVAAMFEADYVFRGQVFSFYDDNCEGEICTWGSLVFKRLEAIKGISNPYIEGDWIEDCTKLWLHPMSWRRDKNQSLFTINSEYLILASDSAAGIRIIGSRGGYKVQQLIMQYQLAVLAGESLSK
jgi:hypothetical protein